MPSDLYDTAGSITWDRKPGVTKFTFKGTGGGGGGLAGDGSNSGNGGGGGGYVEAEFTGLSDPSYSGVLGAGGLGEDPDISQPVSSGGDTYINVGDDLAQADGGADGSARVGGSWTATSGAGFNGGTGGLGGTGGEVSGAGGGGGAGDTGDGGDGHDFSPSSDGFGGAGAATRGGNGGDGDVGGNGSDGSQYGGGGAGATSGRGGNGASGFVEVAFEYGTLVVTVQPSTTDSGLPIATITVQIKDIDGAADTSADTAAAGNLISVAILSGAGSFTAGTTTKAYGSGANGSLADFNDLVITGAGPFVLRFTDAVTGIFVDTDSFTIVSHDVTVADFIVDGVAFTASATFGAGAKTATSDLVVHNISGVASAAFSPGTHTANAAPSVTGINLAAAASSFLYCTGDFTVHNIGGVASATFSPGTHTANADLTVTGIAFAATAAGTTPTATATAGLTVRNISGAALTTFAPGTHTATADRTLSGISFAADMVFAASVSIGTANLSTHNITFAAATSFSPGTHTATSADFTAHVVYAATASFSPGTHTATAALLVPSVVFVASGNVTNCEFYKRYRHITRYEPHNDFPAGRLVFYRDHVTYLCKYGRREEVRIVTHIKRYRIH
jgi:hypothetical protein